MLVKFKILNLIIMEQIIIILIFFLVNKFNGLIITDQNQNNYPNKIRKCYFCKVSNFKKYIPLEEGDYYLTPEGYKCFTEKYHLKRGYCCENGCKHCPYGFDKKKN